MTPEACEVADIANVVAVAILIDVFVVHLLPSQLLDIVKGFQDGARILPPATQVVHLAVAWVLVDRFDGLCDVVAVNVVTDLLALVSEDAIGLAEELDLDQIGQEPVKLDAGMMRTGQTTGAEAVCLHPEIPPILLRHYIGGDFA